MHVFLQRSPQWSGEERIVAQEEWMKSPAPGMSQQRSLLGEGQRATTKHVTLEKVISH